MARRREFSVADLPMVGGALVLDFVNTTGARASEAPRERLRSYGDFLLWARRSRLLDDGQAQAVESAASRAPEDAAGALQRALALREDAYAVLAPLAIGAEPSGAQLRRIELWIARAFGERKLDFRDGRPVWTWAITPDRLDSVLWPIVGSLESMLAGGDMTRLRRCGECDWLFLDKSRRGGRQWCKKLCGDRVRSRRYYRRAAQAGMRGD